MRQTEQPPGRHWQQVNPQRLLRQIEQAGVVGLGGGGFPTARKLAIALQWQQQGAGRNIRLLGNAVACEPGIDADIFTLKQAPLTALSGLWIVAHVLGVEEPILALGPRLQAQQTSLAAQWQSLVGDQGPRLQFHLAPDTAAAGAERLLIEAVFRQRMDSTAAPAAQGVVVQNITTLWAVAQAVLHHEPLTRRPVTLGAQTRWLDLGTATSQLPIARQAPLHSGGLWSAELVSAEHRISARTLALHPARPRAATPCIRCSQCLDACPVALDPEHLYRLGAASAPEAPWLATTAQPADQAARLEAAGLSDCIECGACNASCPSEIDLLASFRHSQRLRAKARSAALQAQRASERFARHEARLMQRAATVRARRADRLARKQHWHSDGSS